MPSQPHLPDAAVRGLVLLGIACLVVVAAVGLRLHDVRGPVRLDTRTAQPVFDHVFGIPVVPERLARWYQSLGNPPVFAALVGVLAFSGWVRRDGVVMWSALLGPPLAEVCAEWIGKPFFNRMTLSGVDSFPSGHVTAMTSIAAVLALVVYRRRGTRGLVWALPITALLSFSMVLSVVRLYSHVMSDALGGIGVGVGVVALVIAVVDVTGAVSTESPPRSRAAWAGRSSPAAHRSPRG